jgi:SAM-dependent methyltransferase
MRQIKMTYDWKDAGEEWSEPWGGSAAQWSGAILPRIRDCLPAETILEIGPGFGRWTHYLKDYCQNLCIVDPAVECIEACRRRFAADSRIHCHVNDGRSLSMLPDNSVDFIFSFDSFVHLQRHIVESYLTELRKKLKVGGKGFIHHSNFGEYSDSLLERLPRWIKRALMKTHILDFSHRRDAQMTADLFCSLCAERGLHCLRQELVNWRGHRLIDCFSLFVRSDAFQHERTQIVRNPHFMREATRIRAASQMRSNKQG